LRSRPCRLLEDLEAVARELWIPERHSGGVAARGAKHATTPAPGSPSREAVACFEQALGALKHLPETRETKEQAIDLRLDLRQSLFALTEFGRILDYLREAEAFAMSLDDQRRLGFVSVFMTIHFWITGDPERAVEVGQRAFAIAEALGDFALQVGTNWRLGMVYHTLGNYPRAIDHLRFALGSLEGDLIYHEPFAVPRLPSVRRSQRPMKWQTSRPNASRWTGRRSPCSRSGERFTP
jgi:tetratricopeptide (TPR) repeat protein